MKTPLKKYTYLFIVVIAVSLFSSCVRTEYVDCDNARVEILNNSDYYIYYAYPFSTDDYCYPENWIEPGGAITIPVGEIHTTSDMPEYIEFYYRFDGPGYSTYAMDIEIEYCSNRVVIQ